MPAKQNIVNSGVTIELSGAEYELRYRAFAFITYAEDVKRDLLSDFRELARELVKMQTAGDNGAGVEIGPALVHLRDILWAGLIDAQPDITRDGVARIFSFGDIPQLSGPIMEAIRRSLPEPPKNGTATANGNPPKPHQRSR